MIGVFCSSVRPQLWKQLHDSLSQNTAEFNLCLAGPIAPTEPLPKNTTHILTNVSPAQCFVIAEHNTYGDYVMMVLDDCVFSPGCLDNLSAMLDKNPAAIVTPVYSGDTRPDGAGGSKLAGTKEDHYILHVFQHWSVPNDLTDRRYLKTDFPLPTCSMMNRCTFDIIGVDKGFFSSWFELDIAFELIERGGQCLISEDSFCSDTGGISHLCQLSFGTGDYGYLLDMWTYEGRVLRTERCKPIMPIVYNDTITKKTQGANLPYWD